MLRVLGSAKTLCNGLTRRDFLQVGSLPFLGLGLEQFLRHRAEASPEPASPLRSFGRAKACILLFLYGSPSQLEWADMKPDAPEDIRGELRGIPSTLPGCDVCELFPNLSRVMDKVTVVRSMTHAHPIHGVAYATTGTPTIDIPMELNPRDGRHWPYIGSVISYLQANGPASRRRRDVPTNIALPWPFSSRRQGEVPRAGPYAAFLGSGYDPIWTEFAGTATGRMMKTLQDRTEEFHEPYIGITPDSRFQLASTRLETPGLTLDRLDRRRSLLQQFDGARRGFDGSGAARDFDRYRAMAFDLIGSEKVHQALDLQREPRRLRESYGMTVFGQGCLAARRLVEAGSTFVSVFWDEFGLAGSGWDTHWDHYNRMRQELCPGLDMGLSGLLRDLDARGMLDETLVLVLSEHGRTPRLNRAKGAGRDHWAKAYTCLCAGGGVARGNVVGRTDRIGGEVAERPVSPKDLLATTYHLLGYDPETLLHDRQNRPLSLAPGGHVVPELLG